MAIAIFLSWLYLWIGVLISSGYKAPEPYRTETVDRICVAILWLPLMIVGGFLDD